MGADESLVLPDIAYNCRLRRVRVVCVAATVSTYTRKYHVRLVYMYFYQVRLGGLAVRLGLGQVTSRTRT